jgi:hypothetical protein
MQRLLEENPGIISQEFTQLLPGLINQAESQNESKDIVDKLRVINKLVLKLSMKANLSK